MQLFFRLVPLALALGMSGCVVSNREQRYEIRLRNGVDQPVIVEVLGLDGTTGASKLRADLAPGGEYAGTLFGYGPRYVEARVRLRDDPDHDRFTLFELPSTDVRREVALENGKFVMKKFAPDPAR